MSVTQPNIDALNEQLIEMILERGAEQAPHLVRVALHAAYGLGKDVKERELRAEGKLK